MEQAITAYYKVTASPEFREVERMREKARRDEAQALHHAKLERTHEIVRNALGMGMAIADIAKLTGLSKQEIEELR